MIDLPSNTIWLDDGRLGVAIVQGDPIAIPPTLHALALASEQPLNVPLFVAPRQWAQYDKPCETCDDYDPGYPVVCGICRDGRQIIDFGEFRATVHVTPEPDGRNWRVEFRLLP